MKRTLGLIVMLALAGCQGSPPPDRSTYHEVDPHVAAFSSLGIEEGKAVRCCGWWDAIVGEKPNRVYIMNTEWKSVRGKSLQPHRAQCIAREPVDGWSTGWQCKAGSYTREQIAEFGRTR